MRMEKMTMVGAALLASCAALAATEAERAAARAELTEGVARIDVGGGALPGGFILMGDDAFPIAECRNYDGTAAYAAAGAFYGAGRAVFLSHPGFLTITDFLFDTKRLLHNAVKWQVRSRATPRIAVLRDEGIAKLFAALGYKDVADIKSVEELKDYDVLALNGVRRDEVEGVLAFVREGGGLIEGSLGWGYMFFNKTACFAEDFADNRLMGAFGVLMGDTGVNRMGEGFPTACKDIPKGTDVDDAIDALLKGGTSDKDARKQGAKTLAHLMNALPSGVRPDISGKLLAITETPEAKAIPAPDHPLGAESIVARLAVLARKNAWLSNPEKMWPADPAAASYPGLVKPGTPVIERDVAVNLSIPKWHSTGVYAAPGAPLTVRIPDGATTIGLKVRVGSTQDDLSGLGEWKRAPLVTVEIPLTKTETAFSSPFGGLVYVVVPSGRTGETNVRLAGGVMAPWFRKGRDTNEKFIRECAETGAPWGEIEGESYVVTSYLEALRKCDDPAWVADYWDKVLAEDLRVSGGGVRRYPERFCSDVQLVAGFLHNGYPLMAHIDFATRIDIAVDKECLARGGAWGVYHEIGHNHQNADWTPEGTGEVTCNIFTLLAIKEVAGRDYRDRDFVTARRASDLRVRRWVGAGKKFDAFKADYFLALEFYARLIDAYGFEALAKTFAAYRQPGFVRPKDDTDKWNVFARTFSKTVDADIAEVMALWSLPVSDETRKACAARPKAPAALFRDLTLEPYVAPKTEPVQGAYMGVSLAGERCGEIELYPTRADIPEGEKADRWKGDWMLLRRVEAQKVRLGSPPGREVEFTRPYYIGVYEVTRRQWFNVMGEKKGTVGPAAGPDDFKPANEVSNVAARGGDEDGVSWPKTGHKVGARSFFGKLRELTGFRAEFDLPTEAQWEAACRAGTTTTWNNGEEKSPYKEKCAWANGKEIERDHVLDKLGRYFGNGPEADGPAVVGSYLPNDWGIYDMHGNVWEQCLDYLTSGQNLNTLPSCSGKDPTGLTEEEREKENRRVICGGSFWNDYYGKPGACEATARGLAAFFPPTAASGAIGLRVCTDGALARESASAPWAEPLASAARAARAEIVCGLGTLRPGVLPGSVYVVGGDAFPVLPARTWENAPACWAAGAFCGEGRVFYLAIEPTPGDNAEIRSLIANARRWLKNGAWFGGVREVDGATVSEAEIPRLVQYVRKGGGLLVTGRAYPWWLSELDAKGVASAQDWPGNRLLKAFGLMGGRFVVRSESGSGDYPARFACLAGAAEAESDAFAAQKLPLRPKPEPTPKLDVTNGTRVPDGAKVAFLGDSITRLGGDKGAWIDQVMAGLKSAGVKDAEKLPAGWDGQTSGDMAGRVGGLLSDSDVKVLTLMCGVNDIWGYDWGRGVELEDYKRNVRAIYDKAAAAGVLVVAMTPTLVREEPDNDYNRLLEPFAAFVREEARRRGLPLADCRKAELEFLKGFAPDTGRHFSYDGVHPVAAGHEIIAREVLKALAGGL